MNTDALILLLPILGLPVATFIIGYQAALLKVERTRAPMVYTVPATETGSSQATTGGDLQPSLTDYSAS